MWGEKKKHILDKEEAFEKIDIIYNKIKYHQQEKMKNEVSGKEIWQELYEAIPYRFILQNEEILDLIVNLCIDNYNDNLNLLKKLIGECEEIKYNYSEKDKVEEKNENNIKKDYRKLKIEQDNIVDKVLENSNHKKMNYKKKLEENKSFNVLNKETSISSVSQYNVEDELKKSENISNKEKNRDVTLYEEDKLLYKLHKINGDLLPSRKEIKLNKIVRNSNVVQMLKKIYKDTCQLCSTRLEISPNEYYSEVHHIRPLGNLHKGSDTPDNAIVLCPNCHKLFDRGSLGINVETMSIISFNKNYKLNGVKINIKHEINPNNLKYHNENIYVNNKCDHKIDKVEKVGNKITKKYLNNSIKERTDEVIDYGDEIEILDLCLNESIIINMKSYWEQNDMPPLQRKLINKREGDIVRVNDYQYKISKIKK